MSQETLMDLLDEHDRLGLSLALNHSDVRRLRDELRLAHRRLLVIQQFLKNTALSADGPFGDGYSGRMLRAKAEILTGEFNPDDFLGKEDET